MRPARPAVERRLRYLRDWELANVAVVPAMIWLMWRTTGDPGAAWPRRAVGVAAVSYVLFQGGVYWHLKLGAVRAGRRALPGWFATAFGAFHRTNLPLFAAAAVWMVAGAAGRPSDRAEDAAWGMALLGFAALEHVNYFVRQLMHDTPADVAYWRRYRRLRRPPLRHDLDAAARRQAARRP
jgi:hypothetical protein